MAGSSASGMLKLLVLEADIGFGVAVWGPWGLAQMPIHLSAFPRTRQEHGVSAIWRLQVSWSGMDVIPALRMRLWAWLLTHNPHTFSLGTSRVRNHL